MVREFRVLRHVLMGILSIGILVPVVAQAFVFTAPRYALLEGEGLGPNVPTIAGVEEECAETTFHGAFHARTLEIEPVYGNCFAKALAGLPINFVYNRCVYLLHATDEAVENGWWKAKVGISCPGEHPIEWHVYENKKNYLEDRAVCATAIPPQADVGTAEVSNMNGPPNDITVNWNLDKIRYNTLYGSPLFCGALPEVVKRDASYQGLATIGVRNSGRESLDLTVRG